MSPLRKINPLSLKIFPVRSRFSYEKLPLDSATSTPFSASSAARPFRWRESSGKVNWPRLSLTRFVSFLLVAVCVIGVVATGLYRRQLRVEEEEERKRIEESERVPYPWGRFAP